MSPPCRPPCSFTWLAARLRALTMATTSSAMGPVTAAAEPTLTSPAVADGAVQGERGRGSG